MRLLVIDGNSIANRAFYGIKLLTTKDGRYTNAIFGFLNILLSLLKESEPDEVAVAFDLKAPTFRHKMYDGYKATRHKMPDELAAQLPVIRQLLALLGYREVTAEAGKPTTSSARWPPPAPPAATTASLPPETGTAYSWSATPPPFCWLPRRWAAARPSPWMWTP